MNPIVFYGQYHYFIDGFLAFLLFWGVAHHSLRQRFPSDNRISMAIGLALAVSLALTEASSGYSLADFKVLAVVILVLTLIFFLGRLFGRNPYGIDYLLNSANYSNARLQEDLFMAINSLKSNQPEKAVRFIEQAEVLEKKTDELLNKITALEKTKKVR